MKILIKALLPHRQKILTQDGEEMRLQQWANKQAASALRDAGDKPQGEQFTQSRDMLMRDAVENPDKHGLKFMGERLPFEGQNLEEMLTEPDVEGEQGAISGPESGPDEWMGDESPEHFENVREQEGVKLFDEQGKLRDGMPPEEEFNPDAEAEHLRRIMTSRQVPMRDAWSLMKAGEYSAPNQKMCEECGVKPATHYYWGTSGCQECMGPNATPM